MATGGGGRRARSEERQRGALPGVKSVPGVGVKKMTPQGSPKPLSAFPRSRGGALVSSPAQPLLSQDLAPVPLVFCVLFLFIPQLPPTAPKLGDPTHKSLALCEVDVGGRSLASPGLFGRRGSLGESLGESLDLRSFLWLLMGGPGLICAPHGPVLLLRNNPPSLGVPVSREVSPQCVLLG